MATEPRFPGSDTRDGSEMRMMQFLFANVKVPEEAKAAGVTGGEVEVKFKVKADGTVEGFKVTEGLGHGCDEEAYRLIYLMPNWVPGTDAQGKPKDMEVCIGVEFP